MLIKDRSVVYNTQYHFVFVTKYRKEIFVTDSLRKEAEDMFEGLAQNNDIDIIDIAAVEDHVHIMLNFKPKYSISEVAQKLKGGFARQWFIKHPETKKLLWKGHLWSPSYYIGSLGDTSQYVVSEYIQNQLPKNSYIVRDHL